MGNNYLECFCFAWPQAISGAALQQSNCKIEKAEAKIFSLTVSFGCGPRFYGGFFAEKNY
jgi:hypothetical protein